MKPGAIVSIPHCDVKQAVVFQVCERTGTAICFGPRGFSWTGPLYLLRPVELR